MKNTFLVKVMEVYTTHHSERRQFPHLSTYRKNYPDSIPTRTSNADVGNQLVMSLQPKTDMAFHTSSSVMPMPSALHDLTGRRRRPDDIASRYATSHDVTSRSDVSSDIGPRSRYGMKGDHNNQYQPKDDVLSRHSVRNGITETLGSSAGLRSRYLPTSDVTTRRQRPLDEVTTGGGASSDVRSNDVTGRYQTSDDSVGGASGLSTRHHGLSRGSSLSRTSSYKFRTQSPSSHGVTRSASLNLKSVTSRRDVITSSSASVRDLIERFSGAAGKEPDLESRRRFISREEAVDVPDPEPAVFHSPQVSKVYPPPGSSSKPSAAHLSKAATIDYAPTSSKPFKDVGRSSRPSEASSKSSTFGRSYTADSAWGRAAEDRWGRQDAVHPLSDHSSRDSSSSRGGVAREPYPLTYPGGRTSSQDRLSDFSDGSSSKLPSPKPRTGSRRPDHSPLGGSAQRIEELPEPAEVQLSPSQLRATRLAKTSSLEPALAVSGAAGRYQGDEGKPSLLGRRQEKRARAMALEAAQQQPGIKPKPLEPVALEHVARSLKTPDSPLVQHAPRKAQPFTGSRSQTVDVATVSKPIKEQKPPSPVPPWRSKEKSKPAKEKVTSPLWDSPISPKSGSKSSKSSQKVLSPTAMLVASSSRLMSPVAMPSQKELPAKPPMSPPKAATPYEKETPKKGEADEAHARAERIAQYKEQRRGELATLYSPPGQEERSKGNNDTNLENFMKHAKKCGLDGALEERASTAEEKRSSVPPLVATVAPMATSTVTSPISSTATVTSPIMTPSTKGSAVVTLSTSDKPGLTSPPPLTSPTTLTSTRVTPTQGLTSLPQTKVTSPKHMQSLPSPKVRSPLSPKKPVTSKGDKKSTVTSPVSEKITSPVPERVKSPSTEGSSSSVLSPEMARRLFFAELEDHSDKSQSSPKPSPSMIPKAIKPAAASSGTPTGSPLTSPRTFSSPLSPKSPSKSKLKSPSKISTAPSPVTSLPKAQSTDKDVASKELIQAKPSEASGLTTTTSVISTVTTSPTDTTVVTSPAEEVTSISVDELLQSGRSKLQGYGGSLDQDKEIPTALEESLIPITDESEALLIDEGSEADEEKEVASSAKVEDEREYREITPPVEEVPAYKQSPNLTRRPVDLHIEDPALPDIVLEPKMARRALLAEPEELSPEEPEEPEEVEVEATIPDEICEVEFEPEPQELLEEQGEVSEQAEEVVDMEALEAEVRLMEQRLFGEEPTEEPTPTTPTTPTSHADLYEQAIASKKRAFEAENQRREEEAAAQVELQRAMLLAESLETDMKVESVDVAEEDQPESSELLQDAQTISPEVLQKEAQVLLASPPGGVVEPDLVTSPTLEHDLVTSPTSTGSLSTKTSPISPSQKPHEKQQKVEKVVKIQEGQQKKRLKELVREDSFNRADSPIREPMPLPKDSVIARHRQSRSRHRNRQASSSSSSDSATGAGSPPRSPRMSPRSPRKPKKGFGGGSRDTTRLGVGYVPVEKERGRSGRPDRHHGDDVTPVTSDLSQQPPSSVPASVSSAPRLPPPAADDPTSGMGQNATKAPSTGTTGLATGSLLPAAGSGTGTPLGASDSSTSTTSSRRGDQRKRYKTRACAEDEEAAASPEVKVRPGKKDKSWVRKSTLNTTIDEENDGRRTSDARKSSAASDDVVDSAGTRQGLRGRVGGSSRSRDDSLTSPEPPSDVASPIRQQGAGRVQSPVSIQSRTLSPITVDSRVRSEATGFTDTRQSQKPVSTQKFTTVQSKVLTSPSKGFTSSQATAKSQAPPLRRSPEKTLVKSPERVITATSGRKSPDKSLSRRKSPEKVVVSPTAFSAGKKSELSSPLSPKEKGLNKTSGIKVSSTLISAGAGPVKATKPVVTSQTQGGFSTTSKVPAATVPSLTNVPTAAISTSAGVKSPIVFPTTATAQRVTAGAKPSPQQAAVAQRTQLQTSKVITQAPTSKVTTTSQPIISDVTTARPQGPKVTPSAQPIASKLTTIQPIASKVTSTVQPKTARVTSPTTQPIASNISSSQQQAARITATAKPEVKKVTTLTQIQPSKVTTGVQPKVAAANIISPTKSQMTKDVSLTRPDTATTQATKIRTTATIVPSEPATLVQDAKSVPQVQSTPKVSSAISVTSPVKVAPTGRSEVKNVPISSPPLKAVAPVFPTSAVGKSPVTSPTVKSPTSPTVVTAKSPTIATSPIVSSTKVASPTSTGPTSPAAITAKSPTVATLPTVSSRKVVSPTSTGPTSPTVVTAKSPTVATSPIVSPTKVTSPTSSGPTSPTAVTAKSPTVATLPTVSSKKVVSPTSSGPTSPSVVSAKSPSIATSPIVSSTKVASPTVKSPTSPSVVSAKSPTIATSPIGLSTKVTSPISTAPKVKSEQHITTLVQTAKVDTKPTTPTSVPTSPTSPPPLVSSIQIKPTSPTSAEPLSKAAAVARPGGQIKQEVPSASKPATRPVSAPVKSPTSPTVVSAKSPTIATSPIGLSTKVTSPTSTGPKVRSEQHITTLVQTAKVDTKPTTPTSVPTSPTSPPPLVSSIQIKPTSPTSAEPPAKAPAVARSGGQNRQEVPSASKSVTRPVSASEIRPGVQRSEVVFGGTTTVTQSSQQRPVSHPVATGPKSPTILTSSIEIKPTPPTSPTSPISPVSPISPKSPTSPATKEVDFTKYGIPAKVGEPIQGLGQAPIKSKVTTTTAKGSNAPTSVIKANAQSLRESGIGQKSYGASKATGGAKPMEFGTSYTKKAPVEEPKKAFEFGTVYKKKEEPVKTEQPPKSTAAYRASTQLITKPTVTPPATATSPIAIATKTRRAEQEPLASGPRASTSLVRTRSSPEPGVAERTQTRRTPERAQSMREEQSNVQSNGVATADVATSNGKAMNRRRFNAVPADEQLARILNRRSRTLEEWEAELAGSDVTKTEQVTAQDKAVKEFEERLAQQKMGKPKEAAIADDEVISVLKARRKEVDTTSQVPAVADDIRPVPAKQSSSTAIELSPLANQPISAKKDIQSPGGIQISSSLVRGSHDDLTKTSAILKRPDTSREPVVSSIMKKEVTSELETKPASILKAPDFATKNQSIVTSSTLVTSPKQATSPTTSITSTKSPTSPMSPKSPTSPLSPKSPTSPSHQSSTFIMVTSSTRKPADPYVEMPSGGQQRQLPKNVQLQRSETLKENVSPAAPETAARKPLKPILRKAKTVEVSVWDPELEQVLRQRRQKEGQEDEEQQQEGPANDISENGEDEEDGPRLTIAERIFKMETKIEESHTSKSYTGSGATTPRVVKLRSAISGPASPGGVNSPRLELASDRLPPVDLADEQLLTKLTDVAVTRDAADRRRQKFQQRKDDDWRTRTAPVTEEEVNKADRLESELKDIPETSVVPQDVQPVLSRKKMVRKKVEAARAAFFEDSDSDFDKLVEFNRRRQQELEKGTAHDGPEEEVEDNLSKMSVSQKMALFRKMEEEEKEKKKGGGSRRFGDRRKQRLERSRTQPVTEEEIGMAAVIAKEQQSQQGQGQADQGQQGSRSLSSSLSVETLTTVGEVDGERDDSNSEDDLSKLSLSEKMKIFSAQQGEKSAPKRDTPVTRRKTRRLQSRFKTQPVTTEEVEKAAAHRISPLALSMVKPPDPELLQTMSLKDQKEFMARWATETLQQIGSRSAAGSRSTSRPGSDGEDDKNEPSKDKTSVRGILKPEQKAELERELRGILRAAGAPYPLDTTISFSRKDPSGPTRQPPGILKKETPPHQSDTTEAKGILKKDTAFEPKLPEKGVLKKESGVDSLGRTEPEKSVLKKDSAFEPRMTEPEKSSIRLDHDIRKTEESKGILRKDMTHTTEVKSVLRVSSTEIVDTAESKKGILKARTMDGEVEVQSILKSPPTEVTEAKVEVNRPGDLSVTSAGGQGQRMGSSTEEDSSTSGGTKRIKNDAVARRRHHREMRKQGERYHTQPIEGSADDGSQSSATELRRAGLTRHHTQPITSIEKEEAETGDSKGGIASRLALLQKSGEEDWRKRVPKKDAAEGGEVRMREKRSERKERPTSIADRLSLLQGSQDSWRDRIEETDVKQFTVAGKLELTGKAMTPDSPLLARRRKPKVPLARGVKRGADSESSGDGSTPSSPTKAGSFKPAPHPTPKGQEGHEKVSDDITQALSQPIMHVDLSSDEDIRKNDSGPVMVDVPKADEEAISEFFQHKTLEELSQERVTVSLDDFDHIFMESQDILPSVQKARPQMRRAAASKNPMKTLAQRRDIQSEYIQVRTDVADREMRRIKREQIAGSACYATEALAGLAAKENFAQVMLRKTDSFTSGTPGNQQLEPYKEVMLMQVKGRRHCQTRLVAPEAGSLNSGDCFILVTPERCWVWVGEFCNVIEKAKAVEVAGVIQAKRDLGCKSPYDPLVVQERAAGTKGRFWDVLGGYAPHQDVGPAEEDEVYEADMAETVRVYRLAGEQFVLWEEVSGCVPRYEMLNTKDILVFDFGSEFYLWTGKQAAFSKRKVALKVAREMWARGYDYTDHGFNPMCPLIGESQGGLPLTDSERPDWTLFGKVNQNMETVLFREKFFDWPDASRLIGVKPEDADKVEGAAELTAFDVTKMVPIDTSPVDLVLEGSHVGRGNTWTELYEGLRREYEIMTLNTKVWHVNEYQVMDLDEVSYGQFHTGDTYVVRWQYMIMQTGMKTLKGADARHSLVGRERCAYFFWQGRQSSVNEKGASALMTVELDEERGPQVRVVQDKEPPCFLNLFKSKMVVHLGKRENEETCTQGDWRFYVVRNELSGEAHLTEVVCAMSSLRSRGSFVLINVKSGQILLWNGSKSGINTRQRALEIAQNLKSSCPLEMGIAPAAKLVMTKMDEGCEVHTFFDAMGLPDTTAYVSLIDDARPWTHTPRLFLMTSVSGEFRATEILNPCRSGDGSAAFPFLQTDLYTAAQPAQFLIDNHHEVYLWQGWWPEGTEEMENVSTGSATARFNIDRRCAMETVLNYCQAKSPASTIPAFVVYAGLEPKVFTNLFPYWEHTEEAETANLKEGRRRAQRVPVKDVLYKLTYSRYTYDELQERPLPDGVDPMKIEAFLRDDEFQRILGMTREEFAERPAWKQADLKKEFSLF